jgi:hypothetical protein
MRVGVVTARMASGERGGAEAFYDGLIDALRGAGHDAAEVPVHVDEATFDSVLDRTRAVTRSISGTTT